MLPSYCGAKNLAFSFRQNAAALLALPFLAVKNGVDRGAITIGVIGLLTLLVNYPFSTLDRHPCDVEVPIDNGSTVFPFYEANLHGFPKGRGWQLPAAKCIRKTLKGFGKAEASPYRFNGLFQPRRRRHG